MQQAVSASGHRFIERARENFLCSRVEREETRVRVGVGDTRESSFIVESSRFRGFVRVEFRDFGREIELWGLAVAKKSRGVLPWRTCVMGFAVGKPLRGQAEKTKIRARASRQPGQRHRRRHPGHTLKPGSTPQEPSSQTNFCRQPCLRRPKQQRY